MEFVMQSPLNMCICFECNKTLTKVNNCTHLETSFTTLKWGAYVCATKTGVRCNMTDHALQKQKKKISDISSGVSGQMFGQSGESVTEENNTQVIQIFSHTSKYLR